jgi:hypothetical protein
MRSLDSVTFDASNLVLEGEEGNLRQWHTAAGDFVSLIYFPGAPNLGGPLSDLGKVRAGYRETAARVGGAIVGGTRMNILGSIMGAIFGTGAQAASGVDVAAILDKLAASNPQKLD